MATQGPVIAIVGATGVVGNEMLRVLEERKVPHSEVRLLASKGSVGELYAFLGEELEVQELSQETLEGVDYALFALDGSLAQKFVPIARAAGVTVIDNSSHYRLDNDVPLIVPEVNGTVLTGTETLIANPNCTTAQLVPVLNCIHKKAGLKRVVVSTYQAVSGAGKAALDELWEQTRAVYTQQPVETEAFQHQIAFNCIPQIDVMLENGYSKEEMKVVWESRKILSIPDLPITVTAVRVPVFHGHAESVNVETQSPLAPSELLEILEGAEGIAAFPQPDEYPMQVDAANSDPIYVGRVRKDESVPNGLNMWIVADNLRKGAALNAVQILELVMHIRSAASHEAEAR
ncbi:MAG: aspartate-semialdehyde dehydrogenase [Bdellovibrionales bacterium]|nr:aspartate-semialdehyde dehydrogenase [Bdellovibrionales bacterium]